MWCSIHQRTARRYGAAAMIALKPALGFADRPGLAIPSGLSSHEPEVALRRRWTRTPRDPVTAGSSHLERVPNTTRAHAEPGRGSQLNLEGPRGLLWTLVASSPKREKYLRTFLSNLHGAPNAIPSPAQRASSQPPSSRPKLVDSNFRRCRTIYHRLSSTCHCTAMRRLASTSRSSRLYSHVSRSGRKGRVVFDPA